MFVQQQYQQVRGQTGSRTNDIDTDDVRRYNGGRTRNSIRERLLETVSGKVPAMVIAKDSGIWRHALDAAKLSVCAAWRKLFFHERVWRRRDTSSSL